MGKENTIQNRFGAGSGLEQNPISPGQVPGKFRAELLEVSEQAQNGAGEVPGLPGTFAKSYQKRIGDELAKDWKPKAIFCIRGWEGHKDDVIFVEDALGEILTDLISKMRDEYNLIIGTTANNPRRAANSYLRELQEIALEGNHSVEIEVRVV